MFPLIKINLHEEILVEHDIISLEYPLPNIPALFINGILHEYNFCKFYTMV